MSFDFGWPRERVPERCRTLVAKGDAVWVWPGIPLTFRRGDEVLPAAAETVRFWITRLHGPEALDQDLLRAIEQAAQCLKAGNEVAAQASLDTLHLAELSQDGGALMRAVAQHLLIASLDLPQRQSMRTWDAQDIARLLPLFKQYVETARPLAKGPIPFDPGADSDFDSKHPRWPAGAPESQGGQFAPKDESDAAVVPAAFRPKRPSRKPPFNSEKPQYPSDEPRGIGDNSSKFQEELETLQREPPVEDRYETVQSIAQLLDDAAASFASLWIENTLSGLAEIAWLNEKGTNYYYQLKANLDPPKTLEELQDGVSQPTLGYHIHHIVELEQGLADGLSIDDLESPENLVRIPEMKHREITNWYQTKDPDYEIGGEEVSPRDYLAGKSWEEKYKLGIQKLIDFGVLKP